MAEAESKQRNCKEINEKELWQNRMMILPQLFYLPGYFNFPVIMHCHCAGEQNAAYRFVAATFFVVFLPKSTDRIRIVLFIFRLYCIGYRKQSAYLHQTTV